MPYYIVCHKKRNNPRMDVRVCEKKCALKEECKELALHKEAQDHDAHPNQAEPVERRAA
jgi:hypothetical protein